ncbi:DUF2088 domain-containing protein [candidate division KSB1 bacterium]|nr:DUF2088 domain-containing protein [candidate division KSB1 bacterium]RQW05610.1 MAG: DUF2088 domain-containing protein [candidate division KSB1 bacterium]
MDVKFPYRDQDISFSIPEDVQVFQPTVHPAITETYTAIIKNLLRPLGYKKTLFDMAKKCASACVVVDAYCPPHVNRQILDPIIKTLHAAGMAHNDIMILLTAEYPSEFLDEQVPSLFPQEFLAEYDVQVHDTYSNTKHELIGFTTRGTPIYLDRRLKEADIKIVTGSVYPHYLFGYAGAPALLTLGLSGPETIQAIYNLGDVWLLNKKSEFYLELIEILDLAKIDFFINILIDSSARFLDIFSGKPERVVKEIGHKFTSGEFGAAPEKADIVITSTGQALWESSWYHNFVSLCLSRSFCNVHGTIIFVTSLFEGVAAGRVDKIRHKSDLIDLFSFNKMIGGTRDKIFSCLNDCNIIFVSPQFNDKSLKAKDREIFFCSSIDAALNFVAQRAKTKPRALLLPNGLLTFVNQPS